MSFKGSLNNPDPGKRKWITVIVRKRSFPPLRSKKKGVAESNRDEGRAKESHTRVDVANRILSQIHHRARKGPQRSRQRGGRVSAAQGEGGGGLERANSQPTGKVSRERRSEGELLPRREKGGRASKKRKRGEEMVAPKALSISRGLSRKEDITTLPAADWAAHKG